MTKRLSLLLFLTIASLSQANEFPHQISLRVVEVGMNVTLRCPVSKGDGKLFSWYKQPLGRMLQTVASRSLTEKKLSEQFNNNRFNLTEGDSQYNLTIKNIVKEDEATYFCQSGTAYSQSFAEGIYLSVNDCNKQTLTQVRQTPETVSVKEGDTVNLHCSLLSKSRENSIQIPSDYSVYWFRAGFGESYPSFIYTQRNNTDACNSSCVYKLSKTIKTSTDTGTYYCAVVTCGRILFGEGTKVDTSSHLSIAVLVLGVLLGCCVALIVALIVYINRKTFRHFKDANKERFGRQKSSGNKQSDTDSHGDEVNYAALNFSSRKTKGVKKRTESPAECLYSGVRGHPKMNEMS